MVPNPKKPNGAMILSILGGLFILLGGLLIFVLFNLVGGFASFIPGTAGALSAGKALGIGGLLSGLVAMVLGVLVRVKPNLHAVIGIILVVIAFSSFVTAAGGFVIGFLLTLVGGILALLYKPKISGPAAGMPSPSPAAMIAGQAR
jgi:hypothetical protein